MQTSRIQSPVRIFKPLMNDATTQYTPKGTPTKGTPTMETPALIIAQQASPVKDGVVVEDDEMVSLQQFVTLKQQRSVVDETKQTEINFNDTLKE